MLINTCVVRHGDCILCKTGLDKHGTVAGSVSGKFLIIRSYQVFISKTSIY
jgi:hypothetical protein